MTLRIFLLTSSTALFVGFPTMARAACLTDQEIEARIGDQVRSGTFALNTASLTGRPLCSGLTLAQRIQQMHDAAFPQEQAQRDQLAAQARDRDVLAQQAAARERAAAAAQSVVPAMARPAGGRGSDTAPRAQPAMRPLVVTTAALGISLDTLLDRVVHADSSSWMSNRYIAGSMHNARYISTNKAHTSYLAYGEYSFQGFGGGSGWVKVRVTGGNLDCLEFWDQAGTCRPLYRSLSQQMLVAGAVGMMSDGGGASSSSRNRIDDPLDDQRRNQNSPPPPPPPPPVTPIGGDRGLYGSDHSCC
ncbi:hypothetical protein QH494_14940 [Sphingomonas sp. AR_OL41]|uniref:hypothetical protein n=1 Tax=Sphingomonas sp. AR_OL41 TaxID=3042729 RepID=UPI0024800970|nr:hypothetical protein [Sphingomonas sp. AR_OL41]MDH7973485.1 hypothetical protein [Sphingomonas sp. AR_OL41]